MQTETQLQDGAIIELPFDGCAQTIVKNGKIMYNSDCSSIEEFCKKKGKDNFSLISWEEFDRLHTAYYIKPFRSITEEQYDEMLCCLPPMKWHDINEDINVFFCSEAMSGEMHGVYIFKRSTSKYYAGQMSQFSTDAEILSHFEKSIQ